MILSKQIVAASAGWNIQAKEGIKVLDNKTILITGGTGSFGNAFTRYVLENYDPYLFARRVQAICHA